MSDIININEAWAGHSGLEVETFLKRQIGAAISSIGGRFGDVVLSGSSLIFYDSPGGSVLKTISLSGDVYNIDIACNLGQVFYILADEVTKQMTITPSTTVSPFGSSQSQAFPEAYDYVVAVDNGGGYVPRVTGTIPLNGSATFDIRPFLSTGDNYIRVIVTGQTSGQVRTMVFTGTLTSLSLNVSHLWQNVWNQGSEYTITGIRFAGSLLKTLHVSVEYGGTTTELDTVTYAANISYTTTATTYTIPAAAFPASTASGVCTINLWMTAQGVSTPVTSYRIMCVRTNDTTPLVCINSIAPSAVNYTSGTIFGYAVHNANKISVDLSATLNITTYAIASGVAVVEREMGTQYTFAYALEVDTGANETALGSLAIAVTAFQDTTAGNVATASTLFDNTYSYIATPGALFYLNAATRDNGTSNAQTIVNEAGASANFAASYSATWSGLAWYNDGWGVDPAGRKALTIPAGATCTFGSGENSNSQTVNFAPLSLLSAYDGLTVEMMIMSGSPSDYSQPLFSISSGGTTPLGILIYPTKITVWGSSERDEDYQTINFSENTMTHLCVSFLKNYEGASGKNLCSVYVNGISNVCFSFDGTSSFGNGTLTIGQANTDAYLYKMRVYGEALESRSVFNNFLNSIVDGVEFSRREQTTKNNILDGTVVDYDFVKSAGFNTMVITTPNDVPIPDFFNQVEISNCAVRFEYAGTPQKNVNVVGLTMDGQGTTSKRYYRWNLRWKTGSETTWSYGDGSSAIGKTGKMINDNAYITVDRITAKKNIASSPQGHKMGLTGLYNDLYHAVGLGSELPVEDFRVAVYQFPFVGFQYNSTNGSYEYLGIYTCGPDKGSKVTFGYSSTYPNLLSIEGPNHAPRGTRFLAPWVDVTYDPADETLKFGGEEGWDADYVKYETSTKGTQTDWDNILALYNSEFQPAYNCVYDNSPYIASVAEVIAGIGSSSITTLAHLLSAANATTVKDAKTNGMIVSNEFITFYDTSYNLYFYRRTTGKFEQLTSSIYGGYTNAKTDLASYLTSTGASSTTNPTTADLIRARAARFKATMASYWSQEQTLFHYCFCILYGVTDNFAKNSYPFKFRGYNETLASGESLYCKRWGWRQDDLDSVLMTDNNGTNTKSYSVEHGDTADNVQIFQGGESALWTLIRDNYADECRTMMGQIASAAANIATSLGIQGSGLHGSLFNVTSYYCWEHSSKYFSATLYETDRRWSYIEPWLLAGTTNPNTGETYPALYNGVAPLTQAVGDQLQGEKLWMERRIAYIFSKFRIGAFTGTNAGYNAISFTLAQNFTFNLTPAIDLYPVVSLVEDDEQGARTTAGTSAQVPISTSGGSNNYIHGGDWLADLGDLSGMRLTSRGGSSAIPFDVSCARLQTLKIGDADASVVEDGFNATSLTVTSPTLTEIDARNTTTIQNTVNLLGCPRLRTVKFAGSGAAGLYLPVGAKVSEVSFPSAARMVFMHSLPFLENENLTLPALAGIQSLYINNCPNLEPIALAEDILETTGNELTNATLIWSGVIQGKASTILALAELAGRVEYEEGGLPTTIAGKPYIEGNVQVTNMTANQYETLQFVSEETYQTNLKRGLSRLFNTNFYLIYDPSTVYISFADPEVLSVLLANGIGDETGVTLNQAAAVPFSGYNELFRGNTDIETFDELKYFPNSAGWQRLFYGSSVKKVTLPSGLVLPTNGLVQYFFQSSIQDVDIADTVRSDAASGSQLQTFSGTTSLTTLRCKSVESLCRFLPNRYILSDIPFQGNNDTHYVYIDGVELRGCVIPSTITEIRPATFYRFNRMTSVTIPNTVTSIGQSAFGGCSGLTSVTIPSSVTSIGASAFTGCSGLTGTVTVPSSITSLDSTFEKCTSIETIIFEGNLTYFNGGVCLDCSSLKVVIFKSTVPPANGTINVNTFGRNHSTRKIYVPYSSDHSVLDAYKTRMSNYSSVIFELNSDGTVPTE